MSHQARKASRYLSRMSRRDDGRYVGLAASLLSNPMLQSDLLLFVSQRALDLIEKLEGIRPVITDDPPAIPAEVLAQNEPEGEVEPEPPFPFMHGKECVDVIYQMEHCCILFDYLSLFRYL
jgi:hypothetical protein